MDGEIQNCTPKQFADAKGILVTLSTYEFVVVLIFWSKVPKNAFDVSTYLQKSSLDLITASHLITIFENDMNSMRTKYESEFKQIGIEATELDKKFDIIVEYKQHRQRKRKRFHDEIAGDKAVFDARKKFTVESYLVSLDSVINSTSKRFRNLKNVASKFSCLDTNNFNNALDADNVNKLECLADTYSGAIDSKTEIMQEFHSFKDMFKEIMSSKINSSVEKLTINNVLKCMRANDMCSIYSNMSTLYHIFLTLPIIS